MEICMFFIEAKFKKGKNINHHGPRIQNFCHLPDPPLFSLPTTFIPKMSVTFAKCCLLKMLELPGLYTHTCYFFVFEYWVLVCCDIWSKK
jgi:hypothetical protein